MYSVELRRIVLREYENGASLRELSETYGPSINCIQSWRVRLYETGDVRPIPHPGRKPTFDERNLKRLTTMLRADPDMTLAMIVDRFAAIGVKTSDSTVSTVLRGLGWSRKKRHFKPASATAATS